MSQGDRLQPIRGAQVIWRGVYEIQHAGHEWAVEVNYLDPLWRVRLHRDGKPVERRRSPARFELPGGAVLEAARGLRRMTKLTLEVDGEERRLRPAPGTAEARRDAFDRRHPIAGRLLAGAAWLILVVAVVVEVPELIEWITGAVGIEFEPPFEVSDWVEALILLLAVPAALDRALRFKNNPILD